MPQPQARRQRQLFEETPALPVIRFPRDVQVQLRQALVQWMQALARKLQKEDDDDEQDNFNEPTFDLWLTTFTDMLKRTATLAATLDPIKWVTLREKIESAMSDLRRQRLPPHFRIKRIITKRIRGASRDFLVFWEDAVNCDWLESL